MARTKILSPNHTDRQQRTIYWRGIYLVLTDVQIVFWHTKDEQDMLGCNTLLCLRQDFEMSECPFRDEWIRTVLCEKEMRYLRLQGILYQLLYLLLVEKHLVTTFCWYDVICYHHNTYIMYICMYMIIRHALPINNQRYYIAIQLP